MRKKNCLIKRLGDEKYVYSIPGDQVFDEEVNSAQLKGVLEDKVVGSTADAVIARLDQSEAEEEITVQIESAL